MGYNAIEASEDEREIHYFNISCFVDGIRGYFSVTVREILSYASWRHLTGVSERSEKVSDCQLQISYTVVSVYSCYVSLVVQNTSTGIELSSALTFIVFLQDGILTGNFNNVQTHMRKSNSLVFRKGPAVAEDETTLRGTVVESVVPHPNTCFRDLYRLEPTSEEALLSDVLKRVWELDAPEIFAVFKYVVLDSFKGCWKFDTLYRTIFENTEQPSSAICIFVSSEHLQSLIEFYYLEALA